MWVMAANYYESHSHKNQEDDLVKNKITITLIIMGGLVVISLLCILDYFNILNVLRLDSSNLNYDVIGIGINTVVVICLAAITYVCLDKRNAEKLENQKASATIILKQIYTEMYKNLQAIEDNKRLHELGKHYEKYGNEWLEKKTYLPFENENLLYEFLKDGSLQGEQFVEYQEIKIKYIDYYWGSIAFHDVEEAYEEERQELSGRVAVITGEKRTGTVSKYPKGIAG